MFVSTVCVNFTFFVQVSQGRTEHYVEFFSYAQTTCSSDRGERFCSVNKFPANFIIDLFLFKSPDKCAEGSLVDLVVFE